MAFVVFGAACTKLLQFNATTRSQNSAYQPPISITKSNCKQQRGPRVNSRCTSAFGQGFFFLGWRDMKVRASPSHRSMQHAEPLRRSRLSSRSTVWAPLGGHLLLVFGCRYSRGRIALRRQQQARSSGVALWLWSGWVFRMLLDLESGGISETRAMAAVDACWL